MRWFFLNKGSNYREFDRTIVILVKNHLILPEDLIYSPLLGSKISDLIYVLNFLLLSGKSREAMFPLHSMHDTRLRGMYEGRPESKERFTIPRYSLIIIIIQKLNRSIQVLAHTSVYVSTQSPLTLRHQSYLGTSLCIPCYTMWSPGYSTSILQVFVTRKRLPVRCSFIFGNRKKSDDARSGLYGGCSKMFQWNYSRSKACVCRAVCGLALPCNRTISHESLPLRLDNLKSHRPAENELTPRSSQSAGFSICSHIHSYFCTYHVTRFHV